MNLVLVRAECTSERLPIQAALSEGIASDITSLGEFSRAFPDANDLARHLTALPLEELQTFFLSEKNRSGEKLELPGVKIPSEAVTSWGVFVLLIVACYFYVTFRDFCSRAQRRDKAWDIPWIGISADIGSRIVFLTSIAVLPLTVGYLAWRGARGTNSVGGVVFLIAFLISIALFFAIAWNWKTASDIRAARGRVE